jgi:hypothetical protein
MNLAHYLALIHRSEQELAEAYIQVADAHADEPDVFDDCRRLAADCRRHEAMLLPFVERYGEDADDEPEELHRELFSSTRSGSMGLLRDLHDLYLMATECDISWTMIGQGAKGARDHDLIDVVTSCEGETTIQLAWLRTRMKAAAPQTLVVA